MAHARRSVNAPRARWKRLQYIHFPSDTTNSTSATVIRKKLDTYAGASQQAIWRLVIDPSILYSLVSLLPYAQLVDRHIDLKLDTVSSMLGSPDYIESGIFHLAMAWNGDMDRTVSNSERLSIIKEKARSLEGTACCSAFQWIPEDTLVHRADINYCITRPWNDRRGRLTLAVDAAHAMLHISFPCLLLGYCLTNGSTDRGQGLNHCICDIHHLLDAFDKTRRAERTPLQAMANYGRLR